MITDIVNAYIGDSSVNRLYQGDQLVWMAGHPDIMLEYIANGPDSASSSTRNVYFDTSVVPDANTKVEIKCACHNNTINKNVPVFSGIDASWKGLSIFAPMQGQISSRIGNSYVSGPSASSNTEYTIITYQASTTGYMSVNGTSYSSTTSSAYGSTSAYLFAYNVNGAVNTSASYSGLKIYYVKIWDNDTLIRTYVPVLHYENGNYVPCFHDTENDTYIYNLGSDTPSYQTS